MKYSIIIILVMMLGGCAMFPGKTKETDFITKQVSTNIPVTETYSNLRQGFRYCGPLKYGVPECVQDQKAGKALCDIYPDGGITKGGRIMGKIQFFPSDSGTRVIMQIRKNVTDNEDILVAWEIFMSGRVREACP